MRTQGIKILGLSLSVALGLIAVTAGAAQAASGEFRVGGKTFEEIGVAQKTILGSVASGELLNFFITGRIFCSGGVFSGTVLQGGVAHVTALFSGCSILNAKVCKIYEDEANHLAQTNPGNIHAGGLGLILLHNGEHYVVFLGHPFATIWIGGGGCTLPLSNTFSGTLAFKLPTALSDLVSQAITNVASEAALATLGTLLNSTLLALGYGDLGLKYGNEEVHIDGGNSSGHLSTLETWGAQ